MNFLIIPVMLCMWCNRVVCLKNKYYQAIIFLHLNPEQQPCQMSKDHNVGCLCCASGPIHVTVYTDRGGYCPGEAIGVSAVINNHSKNEILGLEIQLIQCTICIASCGKRFNCWQLDN